MSAFQFRADEITFIRHHCRLSMGENLVLEVVERHKGPSGFCELAAPTIASRAGYSVRHTKRCLSSLRRKGLLAARERKDPNKKGGIYNLSSQRRMMALPSATKRALESKRRRDNAMRAWLAVCERRERETAVKLSRDEARRFMDRLKYAGDLVEARDNPHMVRQLKLAERQALEKGRGILQRAGVYGGDTDDTVLKKIFINICAKHIGQGLLKWDERTHYPFCMEVTKLIKKRVG